MRRGVWKRAARENRSRGVRARVAADDGREARCAGARARGAYPHPSRAYPAEKERRLGFKTMLRRTFCYIEFIFVVV